MKTNIKSSIWLDSDKAYILNIGKNSEKIIKINSEIEHHVRYDGETDSSSRMGTQYLNKEKSSEERKKHQEHSYFKEIIKNLPDPDQIMICGPSLIKKGLEKEINKIKSWNGKIENVLTVDSMTENQIVAFLKDYYTKAAN